ncbi:MAG: hypothetical protein RL016_312 [Actinomycetota bacterium]
MGIRRYRKVSAGLSNEANSAGDIEITPLRKPRVEVVLVDSPEGIFSALEPLQSGEGYLAVDAERASGFRYAQSAYLIQLHRRGTPVYLIDPQAALTDEPARVALATFMREQVWILHASTQDLPCLKELGLSPRALFDTELGSRLVGLPRVGLGAVVEHYLHLGLAKEHSAVDWSTRPLPEAWLDYAALDVEVLPDLANELEADLRERGKADIAAAEFAHLLGFEPKEKKPDKWRSTTGAHEIKTQRGLAIVRELWEARENLARKLDVSPGRLIPDASIAAAAKLMPRTKSELAGERTFNGRASRTYLDTWWNAIQLGSNTNDLPPLKLPHTGIPNHRIWSTRFPEADARLKAARPVVQAIADELELPVENLLTPDYLRQLCWTFPELGDKSTADFLGELGARSWQIEAVAQPLAEALANVSVGERAESADQQPAG